MKQSSFYEYYYYHNVVGAIIIHFLRLVIYYTFSVSEFGIHSIGVKHMIVNDL